MQRKRLDSWKSIAEYLQRSTRTAQRWHAAHGLPIHHLPGEKGAAFAYADEIDAWLPTVSRLQPATSGTSAAATSRANQLLATANQLWQIRSERNIHSISKLYREAIDEDPGNVDAFIGLANTLIFACIHGMLAGAVGYPRAQEALHRISGAEPLNLDARCCAAWLDLVWKRKWERARAAFEHVLLEEPRNTSALFGKAMLCIAEGRLVEALDLSWEAWGLNTLVEPLSAMLCWIPYLEGKYHKALQQISDVRVSGAYGATYAAIEALALIQTDSLRPHLERFEALTYDYPNDRTLDGVLGYVYAKSGDGERAHTTIQQLRSDPKNTAYAAALVWIGLNRHEEALHSLKACYASGSRWSFGFRADPMLKPLTRNAQFAALLERAGPRRANPASGNGG